MLFVVRRATAYAYCAKCRRCRKQCSGAKTAQEQRLRRSAIIRTFNLVDDEFARGRLGSGARPAALGEVEEDGRALCQEELQRRRPQHVPPAVYLQCEHTLLLVT